MRLPRWLKFLPAGNYILHGRTTGTGSTVTITLVADTTQFTAAMARATTAMNTLKFAAGTKPFSESMRELGSTLQINRAKVLELFWTAERLMEGNKARLYVRGGLDPAYATPDARDAYVKRLARVEHYGPELATAFLAGWVDTYGRDQAREPFIRHTLLGDTPVQVRA